MYIYWSKNVIVIPIREGQKVPTRILLLSTYLMLYNLNTNSHERLNRNDVWAARRRASGDMT